MGRSSQGVPGFVGTNIAQLNQVVAVVDGDGQVAIAHGHGVTVKGVGAVGRLPIDVRNIGDVVELEAQGAVLLTQGLDLRLGQFPVGVGVAAVAGGENNAAIGGCGQGSCHRSPTLEQPPE